MIGLSRTPGTRVGPYEIVALLGAGGMGEVYRATDTHVDRHVAVKVLPGSFALDADRVARFTRGAETLAALNHPNIAAIYGLEKTGDLTALVMELVEGEDLSAELVEGEDLSAHIARGAMQVADALPIARQIADALEAAHEQGIIHRDLKPQNIKVRADGTVKVLDFGLAKARDPVGASSASASAVANSPTLMSPAMTAMGVILGTAGYMSPEQARGRSVDKRADIWAFGAVLYEMLTGTRAFPGEDITDTIVSVVSKEPQWSLLPGDLSPTMTVFLKRCLQKDPKQRLGDIHDMCLALDGAFDTAAPQTTATASSPAAHRWRPWAFAGTGALVAALRLNLETGTRTRSMWVVSRDGKTEPRQLLSDAAMPNISTDGRWLAYASGSPGEVYVQPFPALDHRCRFRSTAGPSRSGDAMDARCTTCRTCQRAAR